ncbi:MAG: hypothetical protein HFI84_11180 [Eubacterium sp.]|nr:hypothetical protein [Eubacterium sp.]
MLTKYKIYNTIFLIKNISGDSNGKIATVVLNLVVLAVFILPITTYAQQTMTQKDNRQDKSDIESEGES